MLTYSQLINIKGTARKNFWLACGTEPALIQDTIDLAKDYVYSGVNSVYLEAFFGGTTTKEQFMEFIDRPYFEDRKLAVVYDSDKLDFWDEIIEESKDIDASTFLIFVRYSIPDSEDECMTLFTNNRLGRAVKCAPLKPKVVKEWIRSRVTISDTALNSLLSKAYGDYEWLLNKIRILEQLDPQEISPALVDKLCSDTGIQSFESSLVEFDKGQCFMYIKDRGTEGISLHKISSDAHNLALLQTVVGQHKQQIRPLVDKTGLSRQQIDDYMNNISYYDLTSSIGCFKTLTKLYPKLARKDELAYLSLVCGW